MVTETDVTLAKASNAVLIAFNVKPSKEAKKLAENEKIKYPHTTLFTKF